MTPPLSLPIGRPLAAASTLVAYCVCLLAGAAQAQETQPTTLRSDVTADEATKDEAEVVRPGELLPGVSGSDFINDQTRGYWEEIGTKLPARLTLFGTVEAGYDSNILSAQDGQEDAGGFANAIAGVLYALRPNDGQQVYSAGGQIKSKNYFGDVSVSDFEAQANGSAEFKFPVLNFKFGDRFNRTVEPTTASDDRAARIMNRATADFGLDFNRTKFALTLEHRLRVEEQSGPGFSDLDNTEIRYGVKGTRRQFSGTEWGAAVNLSQLDYTDRFSPSGFDTLRAYGLLKGELGRSLNYNLQLGIANVISVDNPLAGRDDSGTVPYAVISGSWHTASRRVTIGTRITADAAAAPAGVDNFETSISASLSSAFRFGRRTSADLSLAYNLSDRVTAGVDDPTMIVISAGGVYKVSSKSQVYTKLTNTSRTSDNTSQEFDRMVLSIGLNMVF
jgi:hypothetical protein